MDYIQKTIEEYREKYCQRWDDETIILKSSVTNEQIEAFLTRALTEQGSLFRKGLGNIEKHSCPFNDGKQTCICFKSAVTETLENWERMGL